MLHSVQCDALLALDDHIHQVPSILNTMMSGMSHHLKKKYTSLGQMMRMNTKTYPLMTIKSFSKRLFAVSLLTPLSYSLFQSHFQEPSTSNTQKISLPKPIWEKHFKDQQQLIIDHNRSLPKSGSPHLPTPQQTAKSQQVHTHQSDESTTDTIKTETTPSDPLLAMAHQSVNASDDAASDISNVLSVKRSSQIQVCQYYPFQHANHTNQQLVDHGANGGLGGSDMRCIHTQNLPQD